MDERLDTLIVEDSADDAELAVRALRSAGFEPNHTRVETVDHLEDALRERQWDLVISDFSLPKMDAGAVLKTVREIDPDVPFIIVSGTIGEERAVAAMRAGAQDYILKGEGLKRLAPAVEREVREAENRRASRATQQEARNLASIVESSADAMVSMTLSGEVLTWNRGAEHSFGYTAEEMVGRNYMRIVPADREIEMADALSRVSRGESLEDHETFRLRRDESTIDVSVTISPIRNEQGEVVGASTVARDITERKRTESRLVYLADHDLLTGLYNRRRFEEELTREISLTRRIGAAGAAMVLNIDNFKLVNDTLGHRTGDELIRQVATLLSQRVQEGDILARIGGDEFAIFLRDEKPERIAERLLAAVKGEPLVTTDRPVQITASVGIARLGEAEVTSEELLTQADLAMYEAKDGGGDCFEFFEAARRRQEQQGERLHMVARVRAAIEQGSFAIHCQPILELATDTVSQYELLVRMRDDNGEPILPAAFLPTADRFGLIEQIDRWMVLGAIDLLAEQNRLGRAICVEVNLSARSMVDAGLFGTIERAIADAGISPDQLIFEVTETTAIENMGDARRLAERLTQLGCRFALDDFGAGFGSFYYLKHLPFDYLKIDGDFIRRLPSNRTDQYMVEAIVQVCHKLEKRTIAEFVEDQETLDLLRDYGVDFAQGYHVGRPVPVEEAFAG